MPHPPAAVEELLRDLGSQLQRGTRPMEAPRRLPTGLPEIDRLLAGGFPRGRLSEIAGPLSSGRTSLALALLARTTQAGEVCAVVDGADGFDPAAAAAAGVELTRVLWVRAPRWREALQSTQHLLEAEGFALLLLQRASTDPPAAPVTWTRLARAAAGSDAALVLLSLARTAGSAAEVALEMRLATARFTGTPPLLEALETEAHLVRHRSAPAPRETRLLLHSPAV